MNMGQGSYIEASVPWITGETGYTTVIRGQFLLLDASTSMKFRPLLQCETLDVRYSLFNGYLIVFISKKSGMHSLQY